MPTDFSRFTPWQQAEMLAKGDPAAVRANGDLWADVAGSLYSRVGDLEQQLRAFGPYWTGAAAEQYKQMIRSLIEGVRQTADVARLIADNVYRAGEALAQAKRYPPHQALPLLARAYAALEAALPPLPRAAESPMAADVLSGRYRPDPALLFSGVYGNGLASAAAALGGRFSNALPRIVGPAGPAVASPVTGALPAGSDPGPAPGGPSTVAPGSLGSFSPSVGRGSFDPSSFTDSVGAGQVSPSAGGTAAPVTPAGVGAAAGAGAFFPPVMPFGGAGAAGAGDGFGNDRAVPVWLTEPEPDVVFGVPLRSVISVIGQEPSAPSPPAGQWGF
ncbi:MAG TPA: WXG100 family type VII secretion target [Candidatus Limnocylindrales bacterium]|nr:WXG100 family type VII secretion target [Candidatus Limnocylindrales bacterium]